MKCCQLNGHDMQMASLQARVGRRWWVSSHTLAPGPRVHAARQSMHHAQQCYAQQPSMRHKDMAVSVHLPYREAMFQSVS